MPNSRHYVVCDGGCLDGDSNCICNSRFVRFLCCFLKRKVQGITMGGILKSALNCRLGGILGGILKSAHAQKCSGLSSSF